MKIGIDVKMTTLGQNAQAPSIFGLCTIIWALSTLLVLLVHSQLDHELDHISTTKVNKRIRRESLSPVMHRLSQNETRTELFGKVHTIATVPERKRSMLVNYGIISSGEYSPEASSKCPLDKSSIEPCTCRSLARGITVECEGLENSKRLTSAFRDLRPYLMHDTVLISIDFKIKNEVFDSMNFIILTFRKGNVIISGEPGSYSLAKLNHTKDALQQVNFMQCIVDLGETTLSHKKLKNLELFETQFKNYNYRWFENLQVEKVLHKYMQW
ncbi:hypothetical protein BIW11_14271 [Tropilaelaps mercedesae]|uniref:Uncharacterized protein n=1 Tax=Tropilaelaps mercedesae TaxID=418985 RepID=A0A1V9WYM1_9ACAR|nr:hypothetical protein BIW11_14271 [Tropilaelaps mercedesae]